MLFPAFIVHMVVVVIGFGATLSGSGSSGAGLRAPLQPGVWPSQPGDGQVSGIDDQVSGISGTVYRLSGNHMPAPNRRAHPSVDSARISGADSSTATQSSSGAGARPGVKATVCIFELTSDNQVVRKGGASPGAGGGGSSGGSSPYYQAVLTHLIRQVDTDDKGYFQVALPPGTYSVFTKKGDLFYASQRDEKNNIAPVKVSPGKITRIQCSVESDHKVVY
jgi:hypothetical protein